MTKPGGNSIFLKMFAPVLKINRKSGFEFFRPASRFYQAPFELCGISFGLLATLVAGENLRGDHLCPRLRIRVG
jgi:hypothetical protein